MNTSSSLSHSSISHACDVDEGLSDQASLCSIEFDGLNDPDNPRNWPKRTRWLVTMIVSLFTFISPVASSISSPSLPLIANDLNIPPGSVLENMTLSIFVLAYALGPLIWGPLSELFGRLPILQLSNTFFLVFNIACSRATTSSQLLVFRFFAWLGGSAPQSVGGGTVGDLWYVPEERGMAMSVYSLAPLIGPSVGPLVGGWIAEKLNWRWAFYATSIADGVLQVIAFAVLRETYAPQILRNNAKQLRKTTGDCRCICKHEATLRLYMAVLYGLLYLTLTEFIAVWSVQYHQSPGIAGLHYLAIALVGGQIGARVLDKLYRRMAAKNGGVGTPEMRLPLLMGSAMTLPIGLLIYGWTVEVDSYAPHAATAIAGVVSFRALAGFGFPLFAGWGNSILALITSVIGCPPPFIFYAYGPRLRAWSRVASVER
ncbi:hypothetical protein M422DRAFT_60051 [Sphaerobolus stellatus SS14]|uniref:Major facilitator superfamily (MFS) profile domain-containing protein n=1 Tax=Sphaerobolus stellatus (strain SS14) TaxID=990650 RepID=A0A0C9VZP0_SPHS4|nr:hypothetical protein M422DRAFT_60051 [Sphaerobolus stellatus SS14]